VVGEPCGNPGISSSCCSNACVDDGSGVATCSYLGGCLPINEICSADAQCCSGSCAQSGTTTDNRPIMRCDDDTSCLEPGEVCFTAAAPTLPSCADRLRAGQPGIHRCFGGTVDVLPSDECVTTPTAA
jgi:hypothetical protein